MAFARKDNSDRRRNNDRTYPGRNPSIPNPMEENRGRNNRSPFPTPDPRFQQEAYNTNRDKQFDESDSTKKSQTAFKLVCKIIAIVIGVLFLVKAGQIIFTGLGPAIAAFQAVISNIFNRFVYALIIAVIIYVLAMAFIGKYMTLKMKKMFIPVCVGLILLYTIAPALSTAIGELLIMLVGLSILFFVIR